MAEWAGCGERSARRCRVCRPRSGGCGPARWSTGPGAFVLPFLAFYLTDELDLTPSFVGLVLGAFGLGSVGRRPGRRRARRPAGPPAGAARQPARHRRHPGRARASPPRRRPCSCWCGLLGLTSNTSRPAFSAMTTDIVAPEDRVRAFSLNYWAINLGFAIAPVLGGLLAPGPATSRCSWSTPRRRWCSRVLVFLKVPESRPGLVRSRGGERPGLDGRRAAGPGVPRRSCC